MIKLCFLSAVFVYSSIASSAVTAAEFFQLPGTKTLYMMGSIVREDVERFQSFIESKDIDTLGLAGPGGSLEVALKIGELVNQGNISTLTIADRDCASACALLFMAGQEREISNGSRLGVHLPFINFAASETSVSSYCSDFKHPSGRSILQIGDEARRYCLTGTYQMAFEDALNLLNLIENSGINQVVFRHMISTPPSEMKWFSKEESAKLQLSNN